MSTETRTKTVIKCDACHKAKAEGLRAKIFALYENPIALGDKQVLTALFNTDLCDTCQDKLVTAMQNFLKVKPSVPREAF